LHLQLIENVFRREPGQPSAMFETIISRSTMIGEAQRHGQTLFQVEPTHKVTDQYRKLAEEVEKRLEAFKAVAEAGEGAAHASGSPKEASRANG
jgi:cellulose biosynthesis protein BcsQ